MSRLANTIRNAKVGLFFHVLFIASQFISRKIFLDGLGDTFIGVISTLQSFIGFLNLAELGIGVAIGYTLYKPIFNEDHKEINQIILFLGSIYKKIGYFLLIGSLLLSAFFPLIFADVEIDLWIIYLAFYGLIFSLLLGYFYNYHVFLLQADQKDYVISKYFQSINISKILLQGLFVYFFQSFVIWILLEVLAGLLYSILIRQKVKKEYPWLLLSGKINRSEKQFDSYKILIKKIKQISIHKFGDFLTSGLDNILVFFFLSAEMVAYFSNYLMIVLNLGILVDKIFSGSKASVGNLVAENNKKNIKQVFWEFMVIHAFIAGFGGICIYYLINPFIILWLGDKYLLSEHTVTIFCGVFMLRQIVQPTETFKQAYGLYDDVWAPIAKGIINLGISIILVQKMGISGLLLGTFVGVLAIEGAWRPYYVFKFGFKDSHWEYIRGVGKLIITFVVALFILNNLFGWVDIASTNFFGWILKTIWISSATAITYGLLLYLTNPYCRNVVQRFQNKLFK